MLAINMLKQNDFVKMKMLLFNNVAIKNGQMRNIQHLTTKYIISSVTQNKSFYCFFCIKRLNNDYVEEIKKIQLWKKKFSNKLRTSQ